MHKMRRLALAAGLAFTFGATQAGAQITVGNADSGNCYPFSCGPTDGLTEYQEAYNAAAFGGITTFNTISFAKNVDFGPMDSGTYSISFYLAANPVGGLSSNLANNLGTLLGSFGTFSLSGAMPNVLSLTGSTITYDPSNGDLLMDVSVSGTSFNGQYNSFFNADYTGTDVSRAWFSTIYGAFGDSTGALQTTFSQSAAAPEPASWAMMVGGFGLVGGAMRARRKTSLSIA